MVCLLTMLLFFCCTIFPRLFCNVFLHVAHVQLHMLFIFAFRITHNVIYSVSYTIYANHVYSNLFVLDRVHIPLCGITALYCFMQPGTSSAVARRRGGGLRCLPGFWMSCGWRVLHPRVCPLLCHRLRAVVSTALFTSATSTAHIAPITATTVISPNNDNVLEQFGGVEANSLCRLLK